MNPITYSPWISADQLIQTREGFRDHWYKDSLGKLTGGWGHLKLDSDPAEFNVAIAKDWYSKDSARAYKAANEQSALIPLCSTWLLHVLCSINFQLGAGWINKFPKTWAFMRSGQFYAAAIEAENSLWFKQTPTRVRDFQAALIYTQACYYYRNIKG